MTKLIFEKSNGVDGINITDGDVELNCIDKKFQRNKENHQPINRASKHIVFICG